MTITDVTMTVIDDCGHFSAYEHPDQVAAALLERSQPVPFLDRWGAEANQAAERWLSPGLAARIDLAPGDHGSALLALLLVAIYVPCITFIAWRLNAAFWKDVK